MPSVHLSYQVDYNLSFTDQFRPYLSIFNQSYRSSYVCYKTNDCRDQLTSLQENDPE